MTDKATTQKLEKAIGNLEELASNYCSCDQHNRCERCVAKRAIKLIESAIDPEHISLQRDRLTNPSERIYWEEWLKEQERHPGLNHGFTMLEFVLCPSGQAYPDRPTQRDAHVAASVIQWIGTNCGRGFVDKCERRIEKEQVKRSAFEQGRINHREDDDAHISSFRDIAEMIASTHHPNQGETCGAYGRLVDEIIHAMRLAAAGKSIDPRMMPAKTCLLAGV